MNDLTYTKTIMDMIDCNNKEAFTECINSMENVDFYSIYLSIISGLLVNDRSEYLEPMVKRIQDMNCLYYSNTVNSLILFMVSRKRSAGAVKTYLSLTDPPRELLLDILAVSAQADDADMLQFVLSLDKDILYDDFSLCSAIEELICLCSLMCHFDILDILTNNGKLLTDPQSCFRLNNINIICNRCLSNMTDLHHNAELICLKNLVYRYFTKEAGYGCFLDGLRALVGRTCLTNPTVAFGSRNALEIIKLCGIKFDDITELFLNFDPMQFNYTGHNDIISDNAYIIGSDTVLYGDFFASDYCFMTNLKKLVDFAEYIGKKITLRLTDTYRANEINTLKQYYTLTAELDDPNNLDALCKSLFCSYEDDFCEELAEAILDNNFLSFEQLIELGVERSAPMDFFKYLRKRSKKQT